MATESKSAGSGSDDSGSSGAVALRYLGFCGADDSCEPELLSTISRAHPYVEWGVLFRPDREGQPRYASPEWLERLAATRAANPRMNLAGHLCGSRVPQVLSGDASFVKELFAKGFRRVQVNATAINGVDTSRLKECVAGLRASMAAVPDMEWIVQRNDETQPLWEGLLEDPPANMSLLFDASCGTGVLSDTFPEPHPTVPCGYAGGMGPENIASVLPRVAAASGGRPTWVDMESRLRATLDGRDVFSIDKCFRCAMNAQGLFVRAPRAPGKLPNDLKDQLAALRARTAALSHSPLGTTFRNQLRSSDELQRPQQPCCTSRATSSVLSFVMGAAVATLVAAAVSKRM